MDQVEQLGRILSPAFCKAIEPEFDKLRAHIVEQGEHTGDRIEKVEKRLVRVERFHWKIAGGVGVLVFLAEYAREWFKFKGHG